MKVIALFATIGTGALAFTPQASQKFATNLAAKQSEKSGNNVIGGAVSFLAGLAFAGQVAVADPGLMIENKISTGAFAWKFDWIEIHRFKH